MPRIPRSAIKAPGQCYHVYSRIAGQQFLLGDLEKQYLLDRTRELSNLFFVKVFGFCIMSNHFHMIVEMQDGDSFSDEEIRLRFQRCYGNRKAFSEELTPMLRRRWSDLSEFMKQVKKGFSDWYNKQHARTGALWSGRFESVVLERDEALINCMAYVDLNAVRANLVDRPESYRFCGLGHHIQSGNRGGFLSLELPEPYVDATGTVDLYRRFVYEAGSLDRGDGKRAIPAAILQEEEGGAYRLNRAALLRHRCRYFTQSIVLGSQRFVREFYGRIRPALSTRRDAVPRRVSGAKSLYSLAR
jgi:REP element-mobilizing transposase RayT